MKELLQLAGREGKVIVVDEQGDVQGVLLTTEYYQKLVGARQEMKRVVEDFAEKVNREILQAQLSEDSEPAVSAPERIDSILSERAQDLFKSMPYGRNGIKPTVDLRSEVIDPNFDFNAEEIKPSFDDI